MKISRNFVKDLRAKTYKFKNDISHKDLRMSFLIKKLDHVLKIDVEKLRKLLAIVQPLSLSKKRSMNKKIREIMTQVDNTKMLEQAQLLSLFLTQKKL